MLRRALERFSKSTPGEPQERTRAQRWNDSVESQSFVGKIRRQHRLREAIYHHIWVLRATLTIIGLVWLLLLPLDDLGRSTYMDENAVSPAQTTTHWNWNDVHVADNYLGQLEALIGRNASSAERAQFIETELESLGISSSTSKYLYENVDPPAEGVNAYSIISPPRSSGVESVLISANWKSLTGGWNLRGIANVMALAKFLRGQNHWARDFVFVFGDEYIEGVEAFLSAYHGMAGSGLVVDPLSLAPQGVIWAGINIDYPGHSFSHLGLYYECVNGVLPNQDLLNAIYNIARWTGGVPVQYHSVSDELNAPALPRWLPPTLRDTAKMPAITKYYRSWRHLKQHFAYAAVGKPAGSHGTFAKYRIEGVTLFAEPATGPHGFHALGIIMESTLRSINNLLERFHASFFFYLLTHPGWFTKIGNYLPAAILLGAGLTVEGLRMWIESGWVQANGSSSRSQQNRWTRRNRRVDRVVQIFGVALLVGLGRLKAQNDWVTGSGKLFASAELTPLGSVLPTYPVTLLASYSLAAYIGNEIRINRLDRDAVVLATSSACHILGGAIVTAVAMINFPQAVVLGLGLTILMAVSRPRPVGTIKVLPSAPGQADRTMDDRTQSRGRVVIKFVRLIVLQMFTPEGIAIVSRVVGILPAVDSEWRELVRQWVLLGNWFVPGFLGVWWVLQLVACTLLWL